ncbi:MAG: antibiotic biosynthesis monooxygenase [Thiotrichales bacterium]|jgi:autoinducer 2-degrading protein|nr:antibiotic biosynthesis monooxygenase [Thiotrichales bacterium]MBT3613090.1 antibiotic biosynthesis monooxygenase [Thiotrichales bacterium]MBT3752133.1 antibiotic biosynthesis monooxygenase [Thiotrichales bacterium]MBT3837805.1 antibiotic biosynthesis monooxygenase [Thiotrichales bacterium]MBT4152112.1 antibiotic biosynthesis monooxygenase [Thiotrichales bacterium]
MYTTVVYVSVKLESVDAFIAASEHNHKASIQEPENRRFDILQDATDSTQFILYEAYTSETGAASHKKTAHYLAWRERVADMMAAPRKGVVYHGHFPQ